MWFPGFHSRIAGPLKGNRWQSTAGVREGGAIVINAADAAFCNASGQCSHFQKSPLNSLQIPTGLHNPFKSPCNFFFLFFHFSWPSPPSHSFFRLHLISSSLPSFAFCIFLCSHHQKSNSSASCNLAFWLLTLLLPHPHTFAQFSRPMACVFAVTVVRSPVSSDYSMLRIRGNML